MIYLFKFIAKYKWWLVALIALSFLSNPQEFIEILKEEITTEQTCKNIDPEDPSFCLDTWSEI